MGNQEVSSSKSEFIEKVEVLNRLASNVLFLRKTGYILDIRLKSSPLDDVFDNFLSVNISIVAYLNYIDRTNALKGRSAHLRRLHLIIKSSRNFMKLL